MKTRCKMRTKEIALNLENNVFREQGGDRLLQQWCLCTTTIRTQRLCWLGTSRESRSTATRTPSRPTPTRLGPTATTRTRCCVTSSSTGNRLTGVAFCTPSTASSSLSLPHPVSFSSTHFQNKIRKSQIITNVNCFLKVKQNTTGLSRHSSHIYSN